MPKNDSVRNFPILSALLFFCLMSSSSSCSFLSAWLSKEIGLNTTNTGIVFSVFSLCAFVSQVCYGIIQDKLGLKKHLLCFVSILLLLTAPAFVVFEYLLEVNILSGAIFGGFFCSMAFSSGLGVLESYAEKASRQCNYEFGHVRMWGSLGAAITTVCAGILFNINCNLNFLLSSCAGLLFFVLVMKLPDAVVDDKNNDPVIGGSFRDILSLKTNHCFWRLIFFILGTCLYSVYDQQFQIYYVAQFTIPGEGYAMYGYITAFQVFLEVIVMYFAARLVNKIGAKNGLIFSGLLMALRISCSALVEGAFLISVTRLLHALQFPLLLVSLFKYNSQNFDARLSSVLYMVGFSCITSLVTAMISPLAGLGYEKYGFSQCYLMMGGSVLFITFVSWFILQNASAPTLDFTACSGERKKA